MWKTAFKKFALKRSLLKQNISLQFFLMLSSTKFTESTLDYFVSYVWLGNFNKTSLPEKEDFYSNFNIKDITDAD